MGSTYQYYRNAARRVERGWAQKELMNDQGNFCLAGAVLRAMKSEASNLSPEMVTTIHGELMNRLSYRLRWLRRGRPTRTGDIERVIWGWNDATGRRQKTVVCVLDRIADRLEVEETRAQLSSITVKETTRDRVLVDA